MISHFTEMLVWAVVCGGAGAASAMLGVEDRTVSHFFAGLVGFAVFAVFLEVQYYMSHRDDEEED